MLVSSGRVGREVADTEASVFTAGVVDEGLGLIWAGVCGSRFDGGGGGDETNGAPGAVPGFTGMVAAILMTAVGAGI